MGDVLCCTDIVWRMTARRRGQRLNLDPDTECAVVGNGIVVGFEREEFVAQDVLAG